MVNSALNEKSNISNKTVKERLKKNLERVAEIDNIIKKLYEDNTSGRLSDKRFDTMMRDFESEQEQLEQLIEEDTAEIDESFSTEYSAERFLKLASKYTNFEELTAVMINELIEKIVVYEAVGKGVERTQRIDIYLNYIGQFILPKEEITMTPEEQAAYEKEQERLRKKRECNRRYMARKREEMKKQEKVQTEECA
mgnify:CR=1 FL=1